MIHTGIPKLDDHLGGGVPKSKSLLYYVFPGVEGEVFGIQTLYTNLQEGNNTVYVTFNSPPRVVRQTFKEFGWDLNEYNQNFAIVDAYSMLLGELSNEKYVVQNPDKIESIDTTIAEAMKDLRGGLIVFGSLSTLLDLCGEKKALDFVEKWNKNNLVHGNVVVYCFTAWPYSGEILKTIRERLFDTVVTVSGIAERIIFGQYYGVSKASWTEPKRRNMLFRVIRPGGIRAYIPKVLVTGPYNSGKSSFIHALSTRSVSVDRLGTTIAMDHGHIEHKGFSVDIFGTPGQERFNPILKMLGGEAMGVFLIIDSTNPAEFPRAKEMLALSMTHGLPYIVVANKQDLPGALKPEEIRERMKIPDNIPIVPAVVTKKIGVVGAFETLLDRILERE